VSSPGATLRVPDGRQGPGPMPSALVEALDLPVARRTAGILPGDRRAAGVGSGTELAQLRAYQVGDDVRQIDAAATARTGEPHVRVHVPERTLTTWLVIDVSPSMAFGTADRLKSDVAEGVAHVIGRLAVRRAGRIGLLTFGSGKMRLIPPRGSRPALIGVRRALAEGVGVDGQSDPLALAHAVGRIGRIAGQPGFVVIVSDFRDYRDWATVMGALRMRHSVLAVEVRDPREGTMPAVGRLALIDPETGARVEIDSNHRALRERFAAAERRRRDEVARELRRLRVDHAVLSTEGDWLFELGRTLR
jgi:uncharacterized protein (DUF58 family)